MTNPGEDAGRTASSDSSAGASEPLSGGYEAPPIEQSQDQPGQPEAPQPAEEPQPAAYAQPPGYEAPGYPPASDYPAPSFPPPGYTPTDYSAPGYPPPYPGPPSYGAPAPGYGPPPPGYGPPPPGYGLPPAGYPASDYSPYGQPGQKTNSMAIASLVASGIGVLCGIGSIVGIVLGILALNQIKQTREGGQGIAIAGIALGGVLVFVWLIVMVISTVN
jgi:Domain of unknown function (DUF4190)